ncbi:ABC transporter permease [Limnochorda pilosa]|uniref:Peptide ABC transporter permease n=1 Tax=Limnochorda pilosa TaxID=1555112 RepID=A0A0K2SLI1_LIMPI|nr:ABC transporter permease [Limnochorda pilosa]BAS27978.1 peptide ABC transporter permease [Limnochorda pilosa]
MDRQAGATVSLGQVILRRLGLLVLVLAGVSVLTFLISQAIPGDPARLLAGQRASEQVLAQIRTTYGLDRPLAVQYVRYMGGLLRGDLGRSIRTGRPVAEDLARFFPATLELVATALLLAVAAGIPLGVISAARRNSWVDHLNRTVSVAGVSVPLFWLGVVVLVLFYGRLGILPGGGRLSPYGLPPPPITGILVLDAALARDGAALADALRHLVLPAGCLAFVHLGIVARQVRGSLLEVLDQDYIRTARAYGLPPRRVLYRHALRNAFIPTLTVVGLALGDLLAGAVVTESIFAWPGMGSYVVDSIAFLDFPAIMGFTLVVALGYTLINLAVDIVTILLDPRIRAMG